MSITIYVGNALDVLPMMLEPNSVHCSVTSPPYYGLRKYAGEQQCDWPAVEYSPMPGLPLIRVEAMTCALGHEPTIEAYVGHLVAIYREVWRALRDDGAAWVVMGDSYASSGKSGHQRLDELGKRLGTGGGIKHSSSPCGRAPTPDDLQQGDLMLVPHRLALALQGDGWLVRNDVVWAKVAPMPESVSGWRWERHRIKIRRLRESTTAWAKGSGNTSGNAGPGLAYNPWNEYQFCPGCPKCEANPAPCPMCDVFHNEELRNSVGKALTSMGIKYKIRETCPVCNGTGAYGGYVLKRGSWRHTRAHEFVFMLTKGMQYWANQEMVKEGMADSSIARMNQSTFHEQTGGPKDYGSGSNRSARKMLENLERSRNGRNPRSVLSPPPEPFAGAHFAVYPTDLIEPLIRATCPMRCCPVCGQGWSPVVKRGLTAHDGVTESAYPDRSTAKRLALLRQAARERGAEYQNTNNILGYRPTCGCGRDDWVPGVVLDHFIGSGTTGLVCDRLGLDCIGVDISGQYVTGLAAPRIRADVPLLADVRVVEMGAA